MFRVRLVGVAFGTLVACAPPVDESLISYFGAPEEGIAKAREAVEVCKDTSNAFAWDLRERMMRNAGFVDGMFEDPERSVAHLRGTLLIHAPTDVVVQLGEDGGKSGCIVGLKGMSPAQSYELTLPWVEHFNGVTSAERGQGLTPNAIEVWRGYGTQFQVFIMAYKTWDVLEAPGAAVRLSQ